MIYSDRDVKNNNSALRSLQKVGKMDETRDSLLYYGSDFNANTNIFSSG